MILERLIETETSGIRVGGEFYIDTTIWKHWFLSGRINSFLLKG